MSDSQAGNPVKYRYSERGMIVGTRFYDEYTRTPGVDGGWSRYDTRITRGDGTVVFAQDGCLFPSAFSQRAANIVASKYFYGDVDNTSGNVRSGARENSMDQLVERVAGTITDWGREDGYFSSAEDADRFKNELKALCLGQWGAFNSPVWFNVGLSQYYGIKGSPTGWHWNGQEAVPNTDSYAHPQASACFIVGIDDTLNSIMDVAKTEAMLFKYGSGVGCDLTPLRSTREKLAGGGKPSGPISFFTVFDAVASVIKSGGKVRRAARMQTLSCDHPDVMAFASCKRLEEAKAQVLIAGGYASDFNGEAYSSVKFQSTNTSIRGSDAFMDAVENGLDWKTVACGGGPDYEAGATVDVFPASHLMDEIANGTWVCGDPGMQFSDTINSWHTCPNTSPINSSNPCSEYMFIDDSACNLASINLLKFRLPNGEFDVTMFEDACRIFITAQDILVDHAGYPTKLIAENSHNFRPLGLGYANLGAFLMANGVPYDSDEGRATAAAITAIMTGCAYLASSFNAHNVGAFPGFRANREPMLNVMRKHAAAVDVHCARAPERLQRRAEAIWKSVLKFGEKEEYGYRNSQVTVLAPCGTIGFMMDCDTTGVEPAIALVSYKLLAGGGTLKLVNNIVPQALSSLGYHQGRIDSIKKFISDNDTIEGCPDLDPEHLPVFDCAFAPQKGKRSIHHMGHVRMMAAAQPFISGAISKTCNLPNDATREIIRDTYIQAWKLGLKAVAIYRDGSKGSQPLSTGNVEAKAETAEPVKEVKPVTSVSSFDDLIEAIGNGYPITEIPVASVPDILPPKRNRLPTTRTSITHKFDIQGHEGYVTVGFFDNGQAGELFIRMSKEGSTIGGLMDVIGTAISIGLQYGVPLEVFVNKFIHSRFEPSGFTKNPEIPIAKSVTDYIFRWLGIQFLPGFREENVPRFASYQEPIPVKPSAPTSAPDQISKQFASFHSDAPPCSNCGSLTVRSGACYKCFNCGTENGCG